VTSQRSTQRRRCGLAQPIRSATIRTSRSPADEQQGLALVFFMRGCAFLVRTRRCTESNSKGSSKLEASIRR
jgi:hypothetical protein